MSGAEALLLGVVQGLSEFLPVSSSGHLLIAQELLGVEQGGLLFVIALHVATIASVLLFYRRRVARLAVGVVTRSGDELRYVAKLALATLPAVGVALIAGDALEEAFVAPRLAGGCLLVTGAVLWTTRFTTQRARSQEPGWGAVVLIGCAQAFAILPGISRSGTTVAAALALGVAPVAAAEFSFLMGAIAVFGAALLMMADLGAVSAELATALSLGAAAALVSGIAAIWLFVRLLRTRGFHRFAYYTWAVGGLFLTWLVLRT